MKTNVTQAAANSAKASSHSLRSFLQQELARRCAKNPQYSLRAFARQLGMDHSTLSQVLRRKRALTPEVIRKLGARLRLDRASVSSFVEHERQFGAGPSSAQREVQQLTHDTVNLVSDWYHYAILELVRLKEFRPDTRWIARVLGITTDEVNVALQRLIRLGMLDMRSRKEWVDSSGDTAASFDDFTHAAIQHLSEQVRKLSLSAVRGVPAGYREHSSTTLAVSTVRLPEALERIARFRRELAGLLERDAERDDVYQLEINLFPVTTLKHNKEN
ncbi:MAG: TIGR02147 family protein [Acidobacteria bacterium]|nr:TIGR02147 family protein [Acidobacteriota bacterium]